MVPLWLEHSLKIFSTPEKQKMQKLELAGDLNLTTLMQLLSYSALLGSWIQAGCCATGNGRNDRSENRKRTGKESSFTGSALTMSGTG